MDNKDIRRMALEAGASEGGFWGFTKDELARFTALVAARVAATEREACAVIAETAPDLLQNSTFDGVAAAIRARGN